MKHQSEYVETRGERRLLCRWLAMGSLAELAGQVAIQAEREADAELVTDMVEYLQKCEREVMGRYRPCPDDAEIAEQDWHPERCASWTAGHSAMANHIRELYISSMAHIQFAMPGCAVLPLVFGPSPFEKAFPILHGLYEWDRRIQ